jgi:hypothetical protein
MKRITYYIGTGQDAYGHPITDADALTRESIAYLSHAWGGVSAHHGVGGWIDPDGRLVTEPELTLTSLSSGEPDRERAKATAEYLRQLWGQQSVIVALDDATYAAVSGPSTLPGRAAHAA